MKNLKKIYENLFMPEYISKTYFDGNKINFLGATMINNTFVAIVEEKNTEKVDSWEDFI